MTHPSPSFFNLLWSRCRMAAKQNMIPGLFLQFLAIVLLVTYYNIDTVKSFWDKIAMIKSENDYLFSALSTSFFGGLLPLLIMRFRGAKFKIGFGNELVFMLLFWAYKGMEVNLLYQYQSVWYGSGNDAITLVKKVCTDMFIYNPFWAVPTQVLPYLWKDKRFSFAKTYEAIDKKLFTLQMPSILFATWIVWIPTVTIVYSFPSALQIPLFNIVLCFWVLILSFLSKNENLKI